MLPLAGLAISYLPDLIRLIAGDKGGTLAKTVADTVSAVTGASTPAEALAALQANTAAQAELREKLAALALQAQQVQNQEADQKRQDELAQMKAGLADTQDARTTLAKLVGAQSSIAWGAPVVSVVVSAGFFLIICLLLVSKGGLDQGVQQLIYVCVGTLATGFATVINFWLGSSQGSRDKDSTVLAMQASSSDQFTQALSAVKTVSSVAMDRPPAASPPASGAAQDHFNRCVAITLSQEGGFSNRQDDPGGPTNFGITQRTLSAFLGHDATVEEVQNLTPAMAMEIYRGNFWNLLKCADLPAGVDLMVFDFGVHSGPKTAAEALQTIAGVKVDGSIGGVTTPAVARLKPADVVNSLAAARLAYLRGLATYAANKDGWERRVSDVSQAALKMVS